MSGSLAGRRALVTGAAAGIGQGICRRLLEDGARVAVVDRAAEASDPPTGDAGTVVYRADVRDPAAATDIVGEIAARWGGLDILVNNAGISRYEPALQITPDSWQDVIATNLSAYFFWAQAAARDMTRRGFGRIVNIASVNSFAAEPGAAHYVASKGGITSLTQALAVDLGATGVTVNAVAPGPIRTPRNTELFDAEPLATQIRRIPLGRAGSPADVAAAVSWLASDDSAFVNGATLLLDGGLLARI